MAGKQNPIVSALLYDFCPAAAHWYVRGAEPDEVFDVVWKAFEDYATGNYRLQRDSPYKNAATDGSDVGAAIESPAAPARRRAVR